MSTESTECKRVPQVGNVVSTSLIFDVWVLSIGENSNSALFNLAIISCHILLVPFLLKFTGVHYPISSFNYA